MKLNNKGMTLTELIVSFVIVSVAVVYFSTTIVRITKVYKNSQEKTNQYVEVNYIFRLLDAYIEKNDITELNDTTKQNIMSFAEKIDCEIANIVIKDVLYGGTDYGSDILQITIKVNEKEFTFNKLLKSTYN